MCQDFNEFALRGACLLSTNMSASQSKPADWNCSGRTLTALRVTVKTPKPQVKSWSGMLKGDIWKEWVVRAWEREREKEIKACSRSDLKKLQYKQLTHKLCPSFWRTCWWGQKAVWTVDWWIFRIHKTHQKFPSNLGRIRQNLSFGI